MDGIIMPGMEKLDEESLFHARTRTDSMSEYLWKSTENGDKTQKPKMS